MIPPYVPKSIETIGNIAIFHSCNLCNEKYCMSPVDRFFLSNEMKNIKRMLIVSFYAMCTKYEQFFIHISQKLKKSKNRLAIYFLM